MIGARDQYCSRAAHRVSLDTILNSSHNNTSHFLRINSDFISTRTQAQYLPHEADDNRKRERESRALWEIRVPVTGCELRQIISFTHVNKHTHNFISLLTVNTVESHLQHISKKIITMTQKVEILT